MRAIFHLLTHHLYRASPAWQTRWKIPLYCTTEISILCQTFTSFHSCSGCFGHPTLGYVIQRGIAEKCSFNVDLRRGDNSYYQKSSKLRKTISFKIHSRYQVCNAFVMTAWKMIFLFRKNTNCFTLQNVQLPPFTGYEYILNTNGQFISLTWIIWKVRKQFVLRD